jgi:rfaE bifunctional protein nucleotidyltransferase chain/domain
VTVSPAEKIVTLGALEAERKGWREQGAVVVLANGAFDMLHVGHLRYLAAAKALGDVLVVAVNSDVSVRASKGPLRPIVPEDERLELLSHLDVVDRLMLFDSETVGPILGRLTPDIHAKGTDYTAQTVPERGVVAGYGGRTVICGDPKDHATTDVIATILGRFGGEHDGG